MTPKRQILVVEDNEVNREMLCAILSDDYQVLVAENGQHALDILERKKAEIALILLDVSMPVMDGLEATRMIRCLPDKEVGQKVIIALTANAMNETKQEVLEAGMDGMLNKPFDVNALQRVLQEVWQSRR